MEVIIVNVQDSGTVTLKSPGFPGILMSTEPKSYAIQTKDAKGHIRMIFDDLDLPVGSYLQVYMGLHMLLL